MSELDRDIQRFIEKHELNQTNQFHCLVEEVGELSEALLTDGDNVIEECADVCFVARSIALLEEGTPGVPEMAVRTIAEQNLEKSEETNGDKITDDR